jgi:signal transduction histidine kinase
MPLACGKIVAGRPLAEVATSRFLCAVKRALPRRRWYNSRVIATQFAPPERALPHIVLYQAKRFLEISPLLRVMMDAVPEILMVLNAQRQIVFANRSLLALLGADEAAVFGLRPGEALSCVHSNENEGGCGTTESCSTCGAVLAILECQRGQSGIQQCRITRASGEALDFRVSATLLPVEHEDYVIFALADISHELRRQALERIFFHDILNTATAMRAATYLIERGDGDKDQERSGLMPQLVERLIDEIDTQRQLLNAENDELAVDLAQVNAQQLLNDLAAVYARRHLGEARAIRLDLPPDPVVFVSDRTLLRRVIGNMLKNALEASAAAETVTLGCRVVAGRVEFYVHNPGSMPRPVQLQVFQRSFSTKGSGRGLGAYSMKLLSERYLKGTVTFSTSPEEGTTFRASYPLATQTV